jgi:hypothetical protein
MTLGTNRVRAMTPTDAAGRWNHPVGEIFGCTVYDLLGGAFTLRTVTAELTTALGVVTTETVYTGAAFQANWNGPSSTWNPATGVLTLLRTGGYAAGTQIKFTVCTRDGAGNDTYSSWYVGIGDAPDLADPPIVGDRVKINGAHFRITGTTGAPGAIRYVCAPTSHVMAGVVHATRNDFEYVSPRGRLDARVVVSE